MANNYFENIKKYYISGYGNPVKRYTDSDLQLLVNAKIITSEEKQEIINSKNNETKE